MIKKFIMTLIAFIASNWLLCTICCPTCIGRLDGKNKKTPPFFSKEYEKYYQKNAEENQPSAPADEAEETTKAPNELSAAFEQLRNEEQS